MKINKFTLSACALFTTGVLSAVASSVPADFRISTSDASPEIMNDMPRPHKDSMDGTTVLVFGQVEPSVADAVKRQAVDYFRSSLRYGHQQVGMPRFLITDKANKAVFAIGGFVQFRTAYDYDGKVGNLDFTTYDIPMTATPQNRQGLLMDASTSRLYFKTLVNTRSLGMIETYIETDFRGGNSNSYTLRLREAYVKFKGLTFGQTVSTFTDLQASPNTIDFEGPNAYTYGRNLMVRYELPLGKRWSMAVSAEYPNLSAITNTATRIVPQRIPDIPLYFQYAWNSDSHIRASGIFRTLNYYNLMDDSNEHQFGWGAQLSGTARIVKGFQLYGMALYGKGIGQYVQDLQGAGFDLNPNPMRVGELSAPPILAWLAGAQVNITPRLPISVGYSQVHVYNEENTFKPTDYRLSQYIVANAFYNISRSFSVGVEYLYGTRYDFNHDFGKASRVQAMVQFNF